MTPPAGSNVGHSTALPVRASYSRLSGVDSWGACSTCKYSILARTWCTLNEQQTNAAKRTVFASYESSDSKFIYHCTLAL